MKISTLYMVYLVGHAISQETNTKRNMGYYRGYTLYPAPHYRTSEVYIVGYYIFIGCKINVHLGDFQHSKLQFKFVLLGRF